MNIYLLNIFKAVIPVLYRLAGIFAVSHHCMLTNMLESNEMLAHNEIK